MDEDIIKFLKENEKKFISGERISEALNVSRTAIWKRIKRLRQMGYMIDASPRTGYRLVSCPDILLPAEIKPILETEWMAKNIHYFQKIDSTNSVAYQLAMQGAEEGEVVIAESQEKGRGRLGRKWFSPPYLNLYISIILRPEILPTQASMITLLSAVATAEAIKKYSNITPTIKWPNDILIRGRKIAGLLNEINSELDRVHFIILGIGININIDKKDFPEEIREYATSLKIETGSQISRKEFICILLKEIEDWYKDFLKEGNKPILDAWRKWADIKDKMVRISSFKESFNGKAIDIDSDGALLIKNKNGEIKRVLAGDIEYLR